MKHHTVHARNIPGWHRPEGIKYFHGTVREIRALNPNAIPPDGWSPQRDMKSATGWSQGPVVRGVK